MWKLTAELPFRILLAVFAVSALLLAIVIPYHVWDGLAYGEWSRLIARTGRFHFVTTTEQMYHRPLFYVGQGWIWRLLWEDEALGRAFGLAFSVVLVLAVWRLCRQLCSASCGLAPYIGAAVLLAIPGVAAGVCSGLTDVPVASMVGAAGAVLWMNQGNGSSAFAVFVLSAFSVLTKPSALPALLGLFLAHLVGPRQDIGRRLRLGCLPLVAGAAVGLAYDVVEARRLQMSVQSFLMAGTTGYYAAGGTTASYRALADLSWLGAGLRFPLGLGLVYSASRLIGIAHRRAIVTAGVLAAVLATIGVLSAHDGAAASVWTRTAFTVLVAFGSAVLLAACVLGNDAGQVVSRLDLTRLALWIGPGLLSWLLVAPYDTRLISAIWAPLAVLVACSLTPLMVDASPGRRWLSMACCTVVILLASSNLVRLDALDWRAVGSSVARGQVRRQDFRRALMPELMDLVDVLNRTSGSEDMFVTTEGRLRYFFPGRVSQLYPHTCQDLNGYDYFVLTTGPETEAFFRTEAGVPGTPDFWSGCRSPRVSLVASTRVYAIFRVDRTVPAEPAARSVG